MLINLESREYWKQQYTRRKGAEPSDVTAAVANIYQGEIGHLCEDEEHDDLLERIASLAGKHESTAKDFDELVDLILDEMHRDDAKSGLVLN